MSLVLNSIRIYLSFLDDLQNNGYIQFFLKKIEYYNFSSFFANISFLLLLLAMSFYWVDLAFFDSKLLKKDLTKINSYSFDGVERISNNFNNANSSIVAEQEVTPFSENVFDVVLRFAEQANVPHKHLRCANLGKNAIFLANLSLISLLCTRWIESGHFPLSNLYESLMFLAWCCTSIHIILLYNSVSGTWATSKVDIDNLTYDVRMQSMQATQQAKTYKPLRLSFAERAKSSCANNTNNIFIEKLLGSVLAPCALFLNSFATFSLPKEMQQAGPLVPALQSNWLMMHVTVMIVSYSALILGSLLSIAFLIYSKINKLDNNSLRNKENTSNILNIERKKEIKSKMAIYSNLDYLSYRVIGIGFPFLTIGILSGAVWANEAWGSYWSWDPKETWALLTWLIFAIYLHTRLTKDWQGEKPAIIASVGFIVVWICFLGVNLLGEGLHSYGFLNS